MAVYFAQKSSGDVKIGFSAYPDVRLAAIRTATGHADIQLMRVIDGGRETETWLHHRFKPLRIHGEWFAHASEMETIVPPQESPKLRRACPESDTLAQRLHDLDKFCILSAEETPRLFALSLLQACDDADARCFIAWVRQYVEDGEKI